MSALKLPVEVIEKLTIHDMVKLMVPLLAVHYPDLLKPANQIRERLKKIKLGPRSLQAWGRKYKFDAELSSEFKRLVTAYISSNREIHVLNRKILQHQAVKDGIICHDSEGNVMWLQEPEDELTLPKLVIVPEYNQKVDATLQAKAIDLLLQNPGISATKLAKQLGCSRETLYRLPNIRGMLVARKEGKQEYKKADQWHDRDGDEEEGD